MNPTDQSSAGRPLARHKALQPLSHEHHQALLVCWKIKAGISKGVDVSRIRSFCLFFYDQYLIGHLAKEEELLFPLAGNDNALVKRAMTEHDALRTLLQLITDEATTELLMAFEHQLNLHIRFEERELFTAIQQIATPAQMEAVAVALAQDATNVNSIENWQDEFWK